MTQKAEEKLAEVTQLVQKIKDETDNRINQLNNIISGLKADIDGIKSGQDQTSTKIGSLNNEIQLAETGIADEKKTIENLKTKLATLNPDLENNKQSLSALETNITNLTNRNSELDTSIVNHESDQKTLTADKQEKSMALADLEASIDKDLESYKAELGEIKNELDKIIENNLVWAYLFEIIETPEVEIMAIIAAKRNISLDDIKGKAKTVSPVFVGRAISKLEADGKIVNNDNLWDLSPSILEAIKN